MKRRTMTEAYARALTHLWPVVNERDLPLNVAVYRGARYQAHQADAITMDVFGGAASPNVHKYLTPRQRMLAMATWRLDRDDARRIIEFYR